VKQICGGHVSVAPLVGRALGSHGVPFRRIYAASRVQRGWDDGYGYALVATGRADAMIDVALHIWDSGPLLPLIEEAGGRFTDWRGARTIEAKNSVGTNGLLHDALLALFCFRDRPRRIGWKQSLDARRAGDRRSRSYQSALTSKARKTTAR